MDPLLLLQAEHEVVRTLFDMLGDKSRPGISRKRMLRARMAEVFRMNTSADEQLLLAAARKLEPGPDHVSLFACIERQRAIDNTVLPDVMSADVESPLFEGRLMVLREYAERLFEEEERIYPLLERLFKPEELSSIKEAAGRGYAQRSEYGGPDHQQGGGE